MDEFATPELDQASWCSCQICGKAPMQFPADPGQPGDRVARIPVDINSLGGNKCRLGGPQFECGRPAAVLGLIPGGPPLSVGPEAPEFLGPSFLDSIAPGTSPAGQQASPYCTEEIVKLARAAGEEGLCIQRQELRLKKQFNHPADKAYLYSFRFRMPATIEDTTHSIRWVTAQWKQEPISAAYETEFGNRFSPSPFLAQRFDDGVLHVTVQDEHCRCRVASAPLVGGTIWPSKDGIPWDCQSTRPGDPEHTACTPQLYAEYGPDPVLSSPRGAWVEMGYRVQASRSGHAVVEISQDGRLIVRLTGKIGYEPMQGETSRTKFKIGHYREYIPSNDTMDIDWVRIEPLAK